MNKHYFLIERIGKSDVSQAPGQNAVGHKSRSFNEQNFDNVEISSVSIYENY